jgi:hypothetical protein
MVPSSDNRAKRANSLAKIAKAWKHEKSVSLKVLKLFLG